MGAEIGEVDGVAVAVGAAEGTREEPAPQAVSKLNAARHAVPRHHDTFTPPARYLAEPITETVLTVTNSAVSGAAQAVAEGRAPAT